MRREIDVWVQQAEIDLESAQKIFKLDIYYVCAFLCQQAVEKMMKAVYMAKTKNLPPNIHNLRELGELIGLPKELLTKARKLSRDFVISRYPDAAGDVPAKGYDKAIAEETLGDAKELVEWLEKQLK
ncbi:MAG: HEPN domain-containing protein [Candidatus Diapherotrites archaeon]